MNVHCTIAGDFFNLLKISKKSRKNAEKGFITTIKAERENG